MESNVVECECREEMPSGLGVLREVQRLYEERLAAVDRVGGKRKMQIQVEVLRSWVSDLGAQNSLLVRAVEDLEAEATSLTMERRRHFEEAVSWRHEKTTLLEQLRRSRSDLRGLLEVLRRLRDLDGCAAGGIRFYDVTEADIFGDGKELQYKLERGDVQRHTL